MIKVLLLIQNDFLRMGITASLKEYASACDIAELENIEQLTSSMENSFFDLLIADISLFNTDAASQMQKLKKMNPRLKITFLGSENDKVIGINYIKNGADAIFSNNMSINEFHSAFSTILNGRKYVFEGLRDLMLQDYADQDIINRLSTRESQIVQLLIKGKRTVEICDELNLAASTVSTMKGKIYKKMKVGNIIDLQAKVSVPIYRMAR